MSNNGLYIIQQLYEVEHIADAKKLNYDQRRDLRQRLSAPLLDALEQWAKDTANLKEVQYRPKGLLGRAAMHILSNTFNVFEHLLCLLSINTFFHLRVLSMIIYNLLN